MTLPSYRELRQAGAGRPAGTAWTVFGADDELGTVNLLTPERVLRAVGEVHLGSVWSLNWRIDGPTPNPYRTAPARTQVVRAAGVSRDDHLDPFYLQYSTQWDGLRHFRHQEGFYNGNSEQAVDDPASDVLGIHRWADHGIVGRGVLLDVAADLEAAGEPLVLPSSQAFDVALLERVVARQGLTIEEGAILLVRTGWVGWFDRLDEQARRRAFAPEAGQPGLAPSEEVAAWLWDHRVAAVAADNGAVEAQPLDLAGGTSLHVRLIAGFGMPLGELFWLDDLAAACSASGRWSFLFMAAPLNVVGGVGSPANAVAVL